MLHSCVSSQNCCVACTTSLTNFSHQSLTSIHKHIIYSPLSLLLLVMIPSSLAICLANWHIHFYLNTDLSCVSRINPLYPGSILWVPNQFLCVPDQSLKTFVHAAVLHHPESFLCLPLLPLVLQISWCSPMHRSLGYDQSTLPIPCSGIKSFTFTHLSPIIVSCSAAVTAFPNLSQFLPPSSY